MVSKFLPKEFFFFHWRAQLHHWVTSGIVPISPGPLQSPLFSIWIDTSYKYKILQFGLAWEINIIYNTNNKLLTNLIHTGSVIQKKSADHDSGGQSSRYRGLPKNPKKFIRQYLWESCVSYGSM